MNWVWATAAGLAAVPLGGILGLAVAYVWLMWSGTSEHEGRRGMLAAIYGIVPGGIGGFWLGSSAAQWFLTRHLPWRATIAGCALGLLFAVFLGIAGLIGGVPLAESRGISNYAGERGAWALFHVALPLALAGGVGGFLLGRFVAS